MIFDLSGLKEWSAALRAAVWERVVRLLKWLIRRCRELMDGQGTLGL